MKVLVTGAAGFIGENLVLRLADSGTVVHAFCYTPEEARTLVHPKIKTFLGDVLDKEKIGLAMAGCQQVYHLAAFAKVWVKDMRVIHDVNVTGTLNVLDKAKELGVDKVVVTSSAGVIGPSRKQEVTEDSEPWIAYSTEYERTKAIMEEKTCEYAREGFNVVIVNPTRVFGPGLLSESNAVTRIVIKYMCGKWHFVPGDGQKIGNYAFIDDVVNGYLSAMEKGRSGERYILGGENRSYNELFECIRKISGKRSRLFNIPYQLMMTMARIQMGYTLISQKPPKITPGLIRKYQFDWNTSCGKAARELGYKITSFESGIQKTVDWINKNHLATNGS